MKHWRPRFDSSLWHDISFFASFSYFCSRLLLAYHRLVLFFLILFSLWVNLSKLLVYATFSMRKSKLYRPDNRRQFSKLPLHTSFAIIYSVVSIPWVVTGNYCRMCSPGVPAWGGHDFVSYNIRLLFPSGRIRPLEALCIWALAHKDCNLCWGSVKPDRL